MGDMIILDSVLLTLLFGLGIMTTYSDIENGIIPNKWIVMFAIVGSIADIIYYASFAQDVARLFLINIMTITVITLMLYITHSLAGGDCKLILIMSLLYPADMYLTYGNTGVTLFIIICFAILYGYVFLAVLSFWKIVLGENKFNSNHIKDCILGYMESYIIASSYVTIVNLLSIIFDNNVIGFEHWIVWILCISVAWASGRMRKLRNKYLVGGIVIIDIALSIYIGVLPVSFNPRTYMLTAILVLCQMAIRTDLYETIPTVRVKKGMILSTFSSMAMQKSRVKGLPGVSAEDLRSRLSEEEADGVRRWGKTANGMKEVTIVKKIPFAIFIFLGYVTYFVIWRVVA